MRIDVTQDDIDAGVAGDCERCPVALALVRATGLRWEVGDDHLSFNTDEDDWIVTPKAVVDFIYDFDRLAGQPEIMFGGRLNPKPFSFELHWWKEPVPCE